MPEISIIVPVYKVEKYLDRCVKSILDQTYTDFELILVDDGSPDNCPAMCDAWAEKDNRIRVVHKENGGLSSARNAGLDIMKGEYVTFVDSDDAIRSDSLYALKYAIDQCHADISIADVERLNEGEAVPIPKEVLDVEAISGIEACEKIYQEAVKYVTACNKLYHRNLFDNLRFPLGKIHEDEFITYKLYYKAERVAVISDKLYYYYTVPGSIMNSAFTLKRYHAIEAFEEREEFYAKQGLTELSQKTRNVKNRKIAALYFQAEQAGKCKDIPPQYKISFHTAWKSLEKSMDNDHFEFFMSHYHPKAIKFRAYKRKLCSLLTKK